ncbi:MAG TPA: SapC family protein [Sphingobium sp.]|uniref:SapC family protein n=1 Tax=Sphingobium sp. TaxID=1912891 RepID=UPI002ED2E348
MMTDAQPPLPLFYQAPELLSSAVHGSWRLADGDAGFAAETPFLPILASEIGFAAASYPVLFAKGDLQPIAVTGIEQFNLFVEQGRWAEDAYVPAYVRRYPFGFIATVNPDGFALAIDAGSDRILRDGEEGRALFDQGEPSELTRQALAFCDAFQTDATTTRAFTDALREQDLLIDQRADVTLPDGVHRGIEGFQIVDADRFARLADAVVLDWHRKGWLALVHFHLMSLQRFPALLVRRAKRATVAVESQSDASGTTANDRNSPEFEKA